MCGQSHAYSLKDETVHNWHLVRLSHSEFLISRVLCVLFFQLFPIRLLRSVRTWVFENTATRSLPVLYVTRVNCECERTTQLSIYIASLWV